MLSISKNLVNCKIQLESVPVDRESVRNGSYTRQNTPTLGSNCIVCLLYLNASEMYKSNCNYVGWVKGNFFSLKYERSDKALKSKTCHFWVTRDTRWTEKPTQTHTTGWANVAMSSWKIFHIVQLIVYTFLCK